MSYLARESAAISEELWARIDSTVVGAARGVLTCRKFLHLYGPLGIGAESVLVDDLDNLEEVQEDGLILTKGRKYVELPILYDDFSILARDLERSGQYGFPVELSKAAASAQACARKEDHFIFYGNKNYGYEGLLTASGINKLKKSDWSAGENAFADIASALELFQTKSIVGTYILVVSPDLYTKLQRIQPGTGVLEIDRVEKLLNGHVFSSASLGTDKAVLLCSDARYLDLVIGQDLAAAYLEQRDLNHYFRVLESLLLRIKRKQAVTVFS